MEEQSTRQLAVVDGRDPTRLVGIVTMGDIVRALAQATRATHGDSYGAVPPFSEAIDMLRGEAGKAAPEAIAERAAPAPQAQQVVLNPNAPAVGLMVRELALPPGALLVTVERGAQTIVLRGNTVLEAGDRVTVFAPPQQLEVPSPHAAAHHRNTTPMPDAPVHTRAGAAPSDANVARARALVLRYGWNAMAYQILNPGIRLWFGADGESVVGYVVAAGYRVVAGAPVGPPEQLDAITTAFTADAHQRGQRVCFFGAQERLAESLRQRGPLAELLLGAQPVWRPAHLVAIVEGKGSLRAQLARARNKGVTIIQWDAARSQNSPELLRCLRTWLASRGLPPMHFLIEPDTLARILDRRVLVAEQAGRVVGYLVASPVPLRNGWLVEQMIRGAGAPNGTVELLLDTGARAMAAEGAEYLTLGLSPLSRRAGIVQLPQSPLIHLLLWWVRAHTRRFYNFEGLDTFKAKFQPEGWEPVYAITRAQHMPLRVIYAIAGAFGGEPPPLFIGRALLRAAGQELRWANAFVRSHKKHPPR